MSEEPLVEAAEFDTPVSPSELLVKFETGLETAGRFEITWWEAGAYRFHYTEPGGIDFRFDKHPKDGAPQVHYHSPPDATTAEPSLLAGTSQPQVVTRVIVSQWRNAIIEQREPTLLNER
ncbi:hypothetical protein [Halonotius pteroides]|uniref:hypothetical protein n=1 Tax=Halonotius pteroides TaxID=268735 RepID=UPI0010589304|nr:hypothetical protein [Halonotius pteroides]